MLGPSYENESSSVGGSPRPRLASPTSGWTPAKCSSFSAPRTNRGQHLRSHLFRAHPSSLLQGCFLESSLLSRRKCNLMFGDSSLTCVQRSFRSLRSLQRASEGAHPPASHPGGRREAGGRVNIYGKLPLGTELREGDGVHFLRAHGRGCWSVVFGQ